ncbi:hypothetical protein DGMP_24320 [Desulfomarina profundi]|uniref:Uncharacterized protein n=2 Tax=Desulfomarina profundi TaxID=2772557 RepID=A0A8D5FNZ8_9BACT|nr:hypothetical protein DGMP_24320 [Desulfomarina profundi]
MPPEPIIVWLRGRYEVVRRDSYVISLRYTIERFSNYAAHRGIETRVQNFIINPFQPLTILELIESKDSLKQLAELARSELLSSNERKRDHDLVIRGTMPKYENFMLFNFHEYALEFTFERYQIGCGAEGISRIYLHYHMLNAIVKPDVLDILQQHDGFSESMFTREK